MTGKQFAAVIAMILIIPSLLGAIWWGVSVATSDTKGKGDAVKIQNDAQNRMQSEAEFQERYADITRHDQRIDQAQAELADAQGREEDLDFYRENLSGAVDACNTAVAEYNALVGNPQKGKWRPQNLPERISPTDGTTDCKASKTAPSPAPQDPADEPETGAGEPSPAALFIN